MAHLALADQFSDGTDRVLDRRAVLVVQVDPVGAEALQRILHGGTDIGGATVQIPWALACVRDEPELGGQHHLVAAALECPADELLVDVGP